ncbi:MAG: hypothetical protein KDB06_15035 [Ilumatobacter sp.]|nr:hypothetical protein [Ilumatobacter sp.]
MLKSRCGVGWRCRALVVALSATGCAAGGVQTADALTTDGRVWRESFAENFSVALSAAEANCLAGEVQDLTRLVGPLVGLRPDDTPRSVFAAMDACVSSAHQADVAAVIVLGAETGSPGGEAFGECVQGAGGWAALGSYHRLMAACGAAGGVQ